MIGFDDLVTPLSVDDAEASIYATLEMVGVTTTNWKPGAVVRTLIAIVALLVSALSVLCVTVAKAGFLDLSSGGWLTLVARYVYGVERQLATFASGSIVVNNTGGGNYGPFAPGALQFLAPSTKKIYVNSASVTIPALTSGISVGVVAVESGTGSNALPGDITALQTPLNGVAITSPSAVLGLDEEDDPTLILRCKEKLGALSPNGPRDAYAFFARAAVRQDGSAIGVKRVQITNDTNGNVNIYVATAAGAVPGIITDPTTDLGAIQAALLLNATPLGVTPRAISATPIVIPITYSVFLYNTSGLTEQQIKDKIAAALVAMIPTQPIGGNVIPPSDGVIYIDQIKAAIAGAVAEIFHVVVVLPAADVVIPVGGVGELGVVSCTAVTQRPPNSI